MQLVDFDLSKTESADIHPLSGIALAATEGRR